MKRLTWLVVVVLSILVVAGCGPKMVSVASGEKITCSECDKVIKTDIKTFQIEEKDVSKYSVREKTAICSSCQAKIEAKQRDDERRRIVEERRRIADEKRRRFEEAQQRAREARGRVVGTWICRFGGILGDAIVHFRSDGTGDWQCPDAQVKWNQSPNGFVATAYWNDQGRPRQHRLSGQLSENGSRLAIKGWSQWGFGSRESIVFERL